MPHDPSNMTNYSEEENPDRTEIWEAVSASTVWVTVVDGRGRDISRPVGGPGNPVRIRISARDRQYNQDMNPEGNPFDTGWLRRVDGGHKDDEGQPGKTDAQLLGLLQHAEDLEELLMAESELNVRRLRNLSRGEAADSVSMSQAQIIERVVTTRWPRREPPLEQRDL